MIYTPAVVVAVFTLDCPTTAALCQIVFSLSNNYGILWDEFSFAFIYQQ